MTGKLGRPEPYDLVVAGTLQPSKSESLGTTVQLIRSDRVCRWVACDSLNGQGEQMASKTMPLQVTALFVATMALIGSLGATRDLTDPRASRTMKVIEGPGRGSRHDSRPENGLDASHRFWLEVPLTA